MSKTPLPLHVVDISQFARTLRNQLDGLESTPSHVEMLNLLAKANGYRNFQHYRAEHESQMEETTSKPTLTESDLKRIKQLIRHFDSKGRLIRWPKKFTLRLLSLWVMWSHIPARTQLTEPEINELLEQWHLFEDHALLRREMADRGLLSRTADGRQYMRVEQQPPLEAMELFKQLRN